MAKKSALLSLLAIVLITANTNLESSPDESSASGKQYKVGFELLTISDLSRSFPVPDGSTGGDRPIRAYLWYPAVSEEEVRPLTIGDFSRIAAQDFALSGESSPGKLPVPLLGLESEKLEKLLERPTSSFEKLAPASGKFPLLVVGQGLYYESPLSQYRLCEYLAGRGYIVASCPLLGTRYRLVNINANDLETVIRDLEFMIAAIRSDKRFSTGKAGVIGYDLGGIAGLILTMRSSAIAAFLSLDCSILAPHYSGLPGSHPAYREENFRVPWMHITQQRFLDAQRQAAEGNLLSDRKVQGENWIVTIETDNHAQFTAYSTFGIAKPLPGYWESFSPESNRIYQEICRISGLFLDTVLRSDAGAAEELRRISGSSTLPAFKFQFQAGKPTPLSSDELLHLIIEKGYSEALPEIEKKRAVAALQDVINEGELRWLAYHFLLWWNRPEEALELFKLNAGLHPASADALASLGEAWMISGNYPEAIRFFEKALKINPEMPGVKAALETLKKK